MSGPGKGLHREGWRSKRCAPPPSLLVTADRPKSPRSAELRREGGCAQIGGERGDRLTRGWGVCTHLGVASLGGAGSGGARVRPAHPPAAGSTVPGARLARAPPAVPPVAQSARARLTPSGTSSAPPGSTVPAGRAWGALPRAVRPSVRSGSTPCAWSSRSQPGDEPVLRSLACTREGIPHFAVPPPSRPPFPGSAAKNGLELQARESDPLSRTH